MRGPQGIQGEPGVPGAGAIIPFSSGTPSEMTMVLDDVVGTASLLGFGNSANDVTIAEDGTISLTGAEGLALNMAFSVPREGTITSIAAYFSTLAAVDLLGSEITISAQLYRSAAPATDQFTPIEGASVDLAPALTGTIEIGTSLQGLTDGLEIPVEPGDRLLMVFTATVTGGAPLAVVVTGYSSAGVGIS
ncbi:exosporium glycoprotein BclB-related protein [Thalassobacillus pellis]|uniref:exosporium glycoprotein BclB-related protein n=1 Tax=Thalassobacillus pellis TaxID=748008 RepID=UPI0019600278|nr:exosporium glycoprotein BclB-related protein [Thalassobacillus pellis]MBM7554010.1 BclB C-terminal domain-containing protein [Thalassobacillus pellis]